MLILDISKTLMYEFWYNYIKPKYRNNSKLCYMDTDSCFTYVKTEDFYEDIANDVKNWFDTSSYSEIDKRPLPIGNNKKAICLFKDELGGKIMIKFAGLRAKTYVYLMVYDGEKKKAEETNKYVIKKIFKFNYYEGCLLNNKIILKSQQRFKSDIHNLTMNKLIRLH